MTEKEVVIRNDIHIFHYSINASGMKVIEFGAIFLLVIAVIVYPFTHFDPPAWKIVPLILSPIAIVLFGMAQHWRRFAKKAFLAYDDEFLFVGNNPGAVDCIPWAKLNVKNSGLADPNAGANILMNIEGNKIRLRLFTPLVCIPDFQTVLYTILTHINENEKANKSKEA